MWLAHAPRVLQLSELTEAAIVQPGMTSLDPEARWQHQDLLHVIGSLVIYSAEDNVISLAHHSVKEYLESTHVEKNAPLFHFTSAKASIEMAKTCLTYLMMENFKSGPTYKFEKYMARVEEYPLLQYAARFWPFHARSYLKESQETLDMACALLDPTRHSNFMSWLEVMISPGYFDFDWLSNASKAVESTYPSGFKMVPKHLTPLYYAASFGLYEVVKYLLEKWVDIDERGGLYSGTALHAAIYRNHPDIVNLLLDSGARTDVRDGNYMTPLDMSHYYGADTRVHKRVARKVSEQSKMSWLRNLPLQKSMQR